ncbi:hypothetical protein ATANTOWER_029597 [Ataeniobius toweri]|uniref:Uncharacterized protein n=1 Tax=Ataeniobius toweri TaxID=208326 RepID=A0ABU7BV04_9TELE|nr:hypothetical protein [Ataeniobius toweri]
MRQRLAGKSQSSCPVSLAARSASAGPMPRCPFNQPFTNKKAEKTISSPRKVKLPSCFECLGSRADTGDCVSLARDLE